MMVTRCKKKSWWYTMRHHSWLCKSVRVMMLSFVRKLLWFTESLNNISRVQVWATSAKYTTWSNMIKYLNRENKFIHITSCCCCWHHPGQVFHQKRPLSPVIHLFFPFLIHFWNHFGLLHTNHIKLWLMTYYETSKRNVENVTLESENL